MKTIRDFFTGTEWEAAGYSGRRLSQETLSVLALAELIREAKITLASIFGHEMFLLIPGACVGRCEYREIERGYSFLLAIEGVIGSRLTEGQPLLQTAIEKMTPTHLNSSVESLGEVVVNFLLSDLRDTAEQVLELWRKEDWQKLFDIGCICIAPRQSHLNSLVYEGFSPFRAPISPPD